ncbi:MAG TPA: hypothetical protein DDZ43_08120, partial [Hyphomonadaceae bacterium]|nr:hypothetical protein [Hyphomonadaceae bacterium]
GPLNHPPPPPNIKKTQAFKRTNSARIKSELGNDCLSQKSEANRIKFMKRPKISLWIPPFTRYAGEFRDFFRINAGRRQPFRSFIQRILRHF